MRLDLEFQGVLAKEFADLGLFRARQRLQLTPQSHFDNNIWRTPSASNDKWVYSALARVVTFSLEISPHARTRAGDEIQFLEDGT